MNNSSLTEFARIDESAECDAHEAEREAAEEDSHDTIPCPPVDDEVFEYRWAEAEAGLL